MPGSGVYIEDLDAAWRKLCRHWEETKAVWYDPVQQRVETDYWTPLKTQVQATEKAMTQLAETIAKAQQGVQRAEETGRASGW